MFVHSLIPDRAVPMVLLKWHNLSSLANSWNSFRFFNEFVSTLVCTKNYQNVPHPLENSHTNWNSLLFCFFAMWKGTLLHRPSLTSSRTFLGEEGLLDKPKKCLCMGLVKSRRPSRFSATTAVGLTELVLWFPRHTVVQHKSIAMFVTVCLAKLRQEKKKKRKKKH